MSTATSVSVTSRSSIEMTKRIEMFFCTEASFDLSHYVLRKLWYSICKISTLPSRTLSHTRDLENFDTLIVSTCRRLSSTEVDILGNKVATVVGRATLTILATVDIQPTILASLLHQASTAVCNRMRMRQLSHRSICEIRCL